MRLTEFWVQERIERWRWKAPDPGKVYQEADLCVTASRDEGLGLALLEAMSYGLPTLSKPVPGHLDFAEDNRNTRFFRWETAGSSAQPVGNSMMSLHCGSDWERMPGKRCPIGFPGIRP